MGKTGLDDPEQGDRSKSTEAVEFNELPNQSHTQYTLQRRNPHKVGHA